MPPRNWVEKELIDIWKPILGVKELGIEDDFFELGGHSLKALQVIHQLKNSQGIDIPIELLFENPTIEQLAEKLFSHELRASAVQHVSRLNPPTGVNLFCFPPISGFGIFYKDLAAKLNGKATVYGFNFIEEDSRMEQYVNNIIQNSLGVLISCWDIQREATRHLRLSKKWKPRFGGQRSHYCRCISKETSIAATAKQHLGRTCSRSPQGSSHQKDGKLSKILGTINQWRPNQRKHPLY